MSDSAAPASFPFTPLLREPGAGEILEMLETTMRMIATGDERAGQFTVFEQITPVGWGPPRHMHSREEEVVYILEGTYEVFVGSERWTVTAGGCAVLPRDVPHGFRNAGSTPGRLLCVVSPAGLEAYFREIAACSPPPAPPQMAEMARNFGLTLLPPGA